MNAWKTSIDITIRSKLPRNCESENDRFTKPACFQAPGLNAVPICGEQKTVELLETYEIFWLSSVSFFCILPKQTHFQFDRLNRAQLYRSTGVCDLDYIKLKAVRAVKQAPWQTNTPMMQYKLWAKLIWESS